MELSTVEEIRWAFYRLVGTDAEDTALTDQGEAENDIAYLYLTRGCRNAQRYMLKHGYSGWRARSAALSFSGSDAADGGRYVSLPTDFLRAAGNQKVSCLRAANGDPWGQEVDDRDELARGDAFYFRGDELWIARTANLPSTLYLHYHYQHPAWSGELADADIDFPIDARALIVAEAANVAKEEEWLVGGADLEQKIERNLVRAREEARDVVRLTRQPRMFGKVKRVGRHW